MNRTTKAVLIVLAIAAAVLATAVAVFLLMHANLQYETEFS